MLIKFKNFVIEYDRNSFILSELWVVWDKDIKWNPTVNAGKEKIVDQCYPSTLERCLEKILHKQKKTSSEALELKDALELLQKINDKFISDLKKTIKTITIEQWTDLK